MTNPEIVDALIPAQLAMTGKRVITGVERDASLAAMRAMRLMPDDERIAIMQSVKDGARLALMVA